MPKAKSYTITLLLIVFRSYSHTGLSIYLYSLAETKLPIAMNQHDSILVYSEPQKK